MRPKRSRGIGTTTSPHATFYHTQQWKQIRQAHINSHTTLPNGVILANKYCIECYTKDNIFTPVHTVDHINPIRNGGFKTDPFNLQSLCKTHNDIKTSLDRKLYGYK